MKLEKDAASGGTPIGLGQFAEVVKKNQAMLYPAIDFRDVLRQKFGGEKLWRTFDKRRSKICQGHYYSIRRILESGGDPTSSKQKIDMNDLIDGDEKTVDSDRHLWVT